MDSPVVDDPTPRSESVMGFKAFTDMESSRGVLVIARLSLLCAMAAVSASQPAFAVVTV
jgi:hypothetical protein